MALRAEPTTCPICSTYHPPGYPCSERSDSEAGVDRLLDIEKSIVDRRFEFETLASLEPSLHWKVMEIFVKNGQDYKVVPNLELFSGIDDHVKLADFLIARGCGLSVVENLKLFRGLDHNHIVNELIKVGDGCHVATHFNNFIDVDPVNIANILVKTDNIKYLVKNLDLFEGIDQDEIARKIISEGGGYNIALNIEKFNKIDHGKLANLFIEFNEASNLTKCLSYLRGLDLSVAYWLIDKKKDLYGVIDNLSSFKNLDTGIAEVLVVKDIGSSAITKYLSIFKELSVDVAKKLMSTEKSIEFVIAGLASFSIEAQSYIKESLKESPEESKVILEKLSDDAFRYVKPIWLRNIFLLVENPMEYVSQEKFDEIIDSHINELNLNTARQYIEIADEFGYRIDDEKRKKVEKKKDGKEIVEREMYENVRVTDELAMFYMESMIEAELSILDSEYMGLQKSSRHGFFVSKEFSSVRARISRGEIDKSRNETIRHIFDWIKKYLLIAVLGENNHQSALWDALRDVKSDDAEKLVKEASGENIRVRLKQVTTRFMESHWKEQFGGKTWSRIAQVAEEVWQEEDFLDEKEKSVLIDIVVDLQHNTGTVLNKDVRLMLTGLKEVLDIKRQIKTIDELWNELQQYIKDESDSKKIDSLISKLRFLQQEAKAGHVKDKNSD